VTIVVVCLLARPSKWFAVPFLVFLFFVPQPLSFLLRQPLRRRRILGFWHPTCLFLFFKTFCKSPFFGCCFPLCLISVRLLFEVVPLFPLFLPSVVMSAPRSPFFLFCVLGPRTGFISCFFSPRVFSLFKVFPSAVHDLPTRPAFFPCCKFRERTFNESPHELLPPSFSSGQSFFFVFSNGHAFLRFAPPTTLPKDLVNFPCFFPLSLVVPLCKPQLRTFRCGRRFALSPARFPRAGGDSSGFFVPPCFRPCY